MEREDSTSLLIATGQAVLLVRCAAMAVVGLIVVAIAPVVLGYGDGLWAAGLFSVGGIVLDGIRVVRLETNYLPEVQGAVAAVCVR